MTAVPATIEALEAVEVVYEDLPGWKQDISKVPFDPPPSPNHGGLLSRL